jgi:DNA polymerase-3 subunit epsilon
MGLLGRLSRIWGRGGPDLEIQEARFTVLDTELTGLDERRDAIVSIGSVRMHGGRLAVGGAFHELVNPGPLLDGRSVVIHGITPSQVEAKPPIDTVLMAFLEYCAGSVLVGHCLDIDLAFLDREARRLTGAPLDHPRVDTLALYGWLRHRQPEHPAFSLPLGGLSLFKLAESFGIPVEQAHTALGDAIVTAQLFQRFLPLLAEAGVTRLAGLLRVGDPRRQAENLLAPGGNVHF